MLAAWHIVIYTALALWVAITAIRIWRMFRALGCAYCEGLLVGRCHLDHCPRAMRAIEAPPLEPPIAIIAGHRPRRVRHEIEVLPATECPADGTGWPCTGGCGAPTGTPCKPAEPPC